MIVFIKLLNYLCSSYGQATYPTCYMIALVPMWDFVTGWPLRKLFCILFGNWIFRWLCAIAWCSIFLPVYYVLLVCVLFSAQTYFTTDEAVQWNKVFPELCLGLCISMNCALAFDIHFVTGTELPDIFKTLLFVCRFLF